MKVYNYLPSVVGREEFHLGCIRLKGDGIEDTPDPTLADVFVFPPDISHHSDEEILALPYLSGNIRRHVFFSISENPTRILPFDGAIVFRTDNCKGITDKNPSTITWSWGSEDLRDYIALPGGGFQYDVSFHGWESTSLSTVACASIENSGLRTRVKRNNFFYGHLETTALINPEDALKRDELRVGFLKTMQASRLYLVPRSKPEGVTRLTLFEAMSMGRVSAHLCDGFVPPLGDRIDWDRCQLKIPESDVERTGEIIREWLGRHSDSELIERGNYARSMWERWFWPDKWEFAWGELVKERITSL